MKSSQFTRNLSGVCTFVHRHTELHAHTHSGKKKIRRKQKHDISSLRSPQIPVCTLRTTQARGWNKNVEMQTTDEFNVLTSHCDHAGHLVIVLAVSETRRRLEQCSRMGGAIWLGQDFFLFPEKEFYR